MDRIPRWASLIRPSGVAATIAANRTLFARAITRCSTRFSCANFLLTLNHGRPALEE